MSALGRPPARQAELSIPRRDADETLRERLGELVERFNTELDPGTRVDLHLEILRTRRQLAASPTTQTNARTL